MWQKMWQQTRKPLKLLDRTQPSHGQIMGSIPVGGTNKKASSER